MPHRNTVRRYLQEKHRGLIPYYVIFGGQKTLQLLAFLWVGIAAFISYGSATDAALNAQGAAHTAQRAAQHGARLARKIEREGAQRRDQACRGLELAHKQEVKDLNRSYRFWEDPPPSFRDLLANPLVLEKLSDDIRNARSDQDGYGQFVPKYCDAPNVGLPEPDPKLPKPPRAIRLALPHLAKNS